MYLPSPGLGLGSGKGLGRVSLKGGVRGECPWIYRWGVVPLEVTQGIFDQAEVVLERQVDFTETKKKSE